MALLGDIKDAVGMKSSLPNLAKSRITDISHLDHMKGFSRRMSGNYSRLSAPHRPKSERIPKKF